MSKSKKKDRKPRKPTELKPEHVAKVVAEMKKELKDTEQSTCEAIRKVARRLGNVRRIAIEHALTKNFKLNLGTVRRQIQIGREA